MIVDPETFRALARGRPVRVSFHWRRQCPWFHVVFTLERQ